VRVDQDLGLIIPVRKHLDAVLLLIKSSKPTLLSYIVYQPDKKYNYSPDKKITAGQIELQPSKNLRWVKIPIDADINEDKLFLIIERNENLYLGITQESLPGIISLRKYANNNNKTVDVFTLQPKKYMWRKTNSICFKLSPEQEIYRADNINNGYARPYGLPNLWISEDIQRKGKEWIEIDFDKMQSISELNLYFDSDLNFRLDSVNINAARKINHEFNAISSIVKDYCVYYSDQGKYKELTRVEDNYQRVNRLCFKKIKTNKIKIEFTATNGCAAVHLYEVRAY